MKINCISFLANPSPKKIEFKKDTNKNESLIQSSITERKLAKKIPNKDEFLKRPQKYSKESENKVEKKTKKKVK